MGMRTVDIATAISPTNSNMSENHISEIMQRKKNNTFRMIHDVPVHSSWRSQMYQQQVLNLNYHWQNRKS
jgi:hypothetical protein